MAAGASALSPETGRRAGKPCRTRGEGRPIRAHTEIVHERQEGHHAFILQERWACAYKLLPDGGRQVIDLSVPGDFMGLPSVLLRTSDHAFRGRNGHRRRRIFGATDNRHSGSEDRSRPPSWRSRC